MFKELGVLLQVSKIEINHLKLLCFLPKNSKVIFKFIFKLDNIVPLFRMNEMRRSRERRNGRIHIQKGTLKNMFGKVYQDCLGRKSHIYKIKC